MLTLDGFLLFGCKYDSSQFNCIFVGEIIVCSTGNGCNRRDDFIIQVVKEEGIVNCCDCF